MSDALEEGAVLAPIFEKARIRGISQRDLAEQAGITPEGLSRLKKRGYGNLNTVERLAGLVGLKIAVVAADPPAEPHEQRAARAEVGVTFRDRHPELVWSNSRASNEVFIQRALLDPRFDILLDAAKEFGPSSVERQWQTLVNGGSSEARKAAPTTERILRHIRSGYEQATRRHA